MAHNASKGQRDRAERRVQIRLSCGNDVRVGNNWIQIKGGAVPQCYARIGLHPTPNEAKPPLRVIQKIAKQVDLTVIAGFSYH
jgi:hypothetical protein